MSQAQAEAAKAFDTVRALLEAAAAALGPVSLEWKSFRELNAQWAAACREHEVKHREVQSRLSAQKQQLDEIRSVEQQISELGSQLHAATMAAEGLAGAEAAYQSLRDG